MWLFPDTIPQPTTLLCANPVIFTPLFYPSIGPLRVEMRLQLLSLLQEQFSVSLISHGVDFHVNKKPTEREGVCARYAVCTCTPRAVSRVRRLNKSALINDSHSSKINRERKRARVWSSQSSFDASDPKVFFQLVCGALFCAARATRSKR